ncbi:hypothetical protein C8R44DRAFT_736451 [Mycena epipterygia]|nr:hypothetical protein C8R44DRAFT_736451 [Mycena epipterygia]
MAPTYFGCDFCERAIGSTDPRIHCLDCAEYDLCANCALGERFTRKHAASHRTRVFKMSGGGPQESITSTAAIFYGAGPGQMSPPARPMTHHATNSFSTVPSPHPVISAPYPTPAAHSILSQTMHSSSIAQSSTPPPTTASYSAPSAHPVISQTVNSSYIAPSSTPPPTATSYHTPSAHPMVSQTMNSAHTAPSSTPPPANTTYSTPSAHPMVSQTMNSFTAPSSTPPPGTTPYPMSAGDPTAQTMNSSYIGPSATPPPGAGPYSTPAAHATISQTMNSSSITSSSTPPPAASPSPPPLPPPKRFSMPPPLPSRQRFSTLCTLPSVGVSSHTMPPRGSTPPPQFQETTARLTVSGWGPFFQEDMSPTAVFIQLMDAIFTYLDRGGTGYLVPESYSRFLINQGYVGQENTWNANLIASFGQTKEDAADAALKRAYDLFSIEYILRPRARDPSGPVDALTRQLQAFGASFAQALAPPSVSGGMMPLLSRKGFIDITSIETLCDPSRGWGNLARVLKMYELPEVRGWGDLPRSVLPEVADERMLARVARVTVFSKEQGERELAAAYAKNKIAAQGRAAALDLIDDRRYRYTYN